MQSIKEVITRYRRRKQKTPALCHILINIRSNSPYCPSANNLDIKAILRRKQYDRHGTNKNDIVKRYEWRCFKTYYHRPFGGSKTYKVENEFFSFDPKAELPF